MIIDSCPLLQRLFIIPDTYEGRPRWLILASSSIKLRSTGFEYWPGLILLIEAVYIVLLIFQRRGLECEMLSYGIMIYMY